MRTEIMNDFYLFFSFCHLTGIRSNLHMQKRDSKSLDSGSSFRSDIDDDTNSYSAGVANDGKKSLPKPPTWATVMASNQSVNDNNINNEGFKHDTDNKRNVTPATGVDSDNNKTDDNDIKSGEQPHEHQDEVRLIMMNLSCPLKISTVNFIHAANREF